MKIPKHLVRPGMTADRKKRVAAFVKERRALLSKAPVFDTTEEAVKEAVHMLKQEENSLPSVWKEPEDIGEKHAVVHTDFVEDAYNAGYAEEVDRQKIFDLAKGRGADEIEEVD